MDAGELVPDDIMIGIVDERLAAPTRATGASCSTASRGRCPGRGAGRDHREQPLDVVVDLEVPRERRARAARGPAGLPGLRHELLGRRAAEQTPWICDVCGGDVVQRDDDTEEAIDRRLDLYEPPDRAARSTTTRARACFDVVDGVGTPDEVLARIVDASSTPARERRPVGA